MKLVRKKDIYTGDIYESLTEGKVAYEIFLNRFYMHEILPEGILVKKNAKLIKSRYNDTYVDTDKLKLINFLYLRFYEEHKSVNDFLSCILKEPKLEIIGEFPRKKGELFIKNIKKYYDDEEDKKISISKIK